MTEAELYRVVGECGNPSKVWCYDGNPVEGWLWEHPDGRTWTEIGDHNEPPPPHPLIEEWVWVEHARRLGKFVMRNGAGITIARVHTQNEVAE